MHLTYTYYNMHALLTEMSLNFYNAYTPFCSLAQLAYIYIYNTIDLVFTRDKQPIGRHWR